MHDDIVTEKMIELIIEILPQIVVSAIILAAGIYHYVKSNRKDETGLTEGEQGYLGSVMAGMRHEEEFTEKKTPYDPKNGEDNEWVFMVSDELIDEIYGELDEEKCSEQLEYLRKKYVFDMGDFEGKNAYTGYKQSKFAYIKQNNRYESAFLKTQGSPLEDSRKKMESSRRMYEGVYADVVINSAIRYFFGDKAEYKKEYGIPFVEFQSIYFGLFGRQLNLTTSNFRTEDLVKGTLDGHKFRQSDLRLTEREGNRDICGRVMTLEGDYPVGYGLFIGLRDSERQVNDNSDDFVDYTTGNSGFDSKYFVKTRDEFYAQGFLTDELINSLVNLDVGGDLILYYTPDMLWVFRDKVRGMFEAGVNEAIDIMMERRYTCLAFMEAESILEAATGIAAKKEERGFDIYGETDVETGEYALSGAGSNGELQTGR